MEAVSFSFLFLFLLLLRLCVSPRRQVFIAAWCGSRRTCHGHAREEHTCMNAYFQPSRGTSEKVEHVHSLSKAVGWGWVGGGCR